MDCKCGKPLVGHYGTSSTLVGYSSPPGHNHDDNCVSREYICEDGHKVVLYKQARCPNCDWVGKLECGCHVGPKVSAWPKIPYFGNDAARKYYFG